MSDVSALIAGKLTPADFVTKAAADLRKDVARIPGSAAWLPWLIDGLAALLASNGLSPLVVGIIINALKTALNPPTPTPAATT